MSRYIVTGGSGFIGQEVVAILLAGGHEVMNLDLAAPRIAAHAAHWRQCDIRDSSTLRRAFGEFAPEFCIHLASDIDIAIVDASRFTTTIDGSTNVFETCAATPSLQRLVHTSTQFVVRPGVAPSGEQFYQPYTVYGEAKAKSEARLWQMSPQYSWRIARPTVIWGPHHPSFADQIFRRIRDRTYLQPVGDAKIERAFGYVTNTAHQIVGLCQAPEVERRVYYIGDAVIDYDRWADAFATGLTGKPARRVPKAALSLLGRVGDVMKAMHLPAPIDSGRVFRMTTSSAVDLSPIIELCGVPPIGFEAGVEKTLAWLRNYYAGAESNSP